MRLISGISSKASLIDFSSRFSPPKTMWLSFMSVDQRLGSC